MPIESGHYIITNYHYSSVAFLSDNKHGTSLVGSVKGDTPGEEWDVSELPNGRYSIVNLEHRMSASPGFQTQKGENVIGKKSVWIWLIKERDLGGTYTIATVGDELRWWLGPHAPIILHDAPPSDPRCQWTFQKIAHVDTARCEATEEELARKARELEVAKVEVVEAKREAEQVKLELARTLGELEATKREVTTAKAVVAEEAAKRKEVESEVFKVAAEGEEAKQQAAQSKAEASRTLAELEAAKEEMVAVREELEQVKSQMMKALAALKVAKEDAEVAQDAAKRKEVELEASRKVAEVEQTTRGVPQIKDEVARNKTYIESFITPQLDTGRYTITNVGSKNVATLGEVNTESYLTGGLKQDKDSEKWGIVLLSNEKYTIQSLATGLYANYEPRPRKGEFVFGSSRPQQWKIKAMWSPGHYVIFPANAHCYWSLPDGEEGTLIVFSDHENSPKNQWFFTKVM